MKILLSHLTGNANVKAATYGFIDAGKLSELHVSLASVPGSFLDLIGGLGPFSEIRRRRFDPKVKPFLYTWPWLELMRLLTRGRFKSLASEKKSPFYIDSVIKNLDKHVAYRLKSAIIESGVNAVYCYEDSSLFTFREANRLGIQSFYDLPIGYWRAAHRLLEVERNRWPEWIPTMRGLDETVEKLNNKDEELKLADRIFVASTFTAETLRDYPGKLAPIEVIPYGFPSVVNGKRNYASFVSKRPLKLLYVGGLSQRKGIADLFEAVASFGQNVTLTLVGRKVTDSCAPLNTALLRHRWIPSLPHEKILTLMREHDVLVFPSLFEGFGLVITEAMSQGTPVITTDRTAGPDLIEHGKNGWLIGAGSSTALKESIEAILLKPQIIQEFGEAAMAVARRRPWEIYSQELAESVGRGHYKESSG